MAPARAPRRRPVDLAACAFTALTWGSGGCVTALDIGTQRSATDAATADAAPDDAVADATAPDPVAEAVHACGLLASCLHGQVSIAACLDELTNPLDDARYAALYAGRALTHFPGEFTTAGVPAGFALVPESGEAILSMARQPAARRCLAAASGCDAVLACLNRGAASAPCTPAGGATPTIACTGAALQLCLYTDYSVSAGVRVGSAGRAIAFDCASQTNPCTRFAGGMYTEYGCARGTCTAGPGRCGTSTSTPSRPQATNCHEGLLDQTVCLPGAVCRVGASNGAACVDDSGATCTAASFTPTCTAAGESRCVDGFVAHVPCDTGLACQTRGAVGFCGLAAECLPTQAPACGAGGQITACALGRAVTIDCHALGFAGCGTQPLGAVHCM